MKVKNINGTGDVPPCKCGSWLKHWQIFSGQNTPKFCPELLCFGKPEVGAHVQMDSQTDKKWYIIPLCKEHNSERGKSLDVSDGIQLVAADISETCGRG